MNALFHSFFGYQNLEEFCSGVFSDSLDQLGFRHQVVDGFLLNNRRLRIFGRVRTVELITCQTDDEKIAKGLGFLDSLAEDDVLVVKGSHEYAYFGELMSRLSLEKGLGGAIIDGLTRDTYYTQTTSFPIAARGYSARDIKGRGYVGALDAPVEIGGVTAKPNDFVFGDSDCLVFISADSMKSVVKEVTKAVMEEVRIKKLIEDGVTVSEMLKQVKSF